MHQLVKASLSLGLGLWISLPVTAAPFQKVPQGFSQEVAVRWKPEQGAPAGSVQLVETTSEGVVRAFSEGKWQALSSGRWQEMEALANRDGQRFAFPGRAGERIEVGVPWKSVLQVLRRDTGVWVLTETTLVAANSGQSLGGLTGRLRQAALSPEGVLHVAGSDGLYRQKGDSWELVPVRDGLGRAWAVEDVRGVTFDSDGALWVASPAGVASRGPRGWTFFEGKDGLPYNDFTGAFAGPGGEVWFATRLGAIRYRKGDWAYRQGPRWMPADAITQISLDSAGNAWFATAAGVGGIERRPMTLHAKAKIYEQEIQDFIKRTPFGYVSEASLPNPADKSTARLDDSDNDGLWTSMYGAGECFGYAATREPELKQRAKQAFEALRFLQKVTQGGAHAPPPGYIARTIRSVDLPDPNIGRLEGDLREQKNDSLWKSYEPRWPKSADGKWYWKSDTSSDELDGHFFFYPLYYEFCAEDETEKERVRDVVRGITDHLMQHQYLLMEHDGKPTRWGIYGPQYLNRDPFWWPERGLNSLSMLAYLTVAEYVTGEARYGAAIQELVDRHGYAHNAMYAKVQHGPGSGNQSDDEMAVMGYYMLLRYSKNEPLKRQIRYSFFRYWANEAPELNPFFNYAYAAHGMGHTTTNPFGTYSIDPWKGWDTDSMATLQGFPLDRLGWAHRNSHRLDLVVLGPQQGTDLYSKDRRQRGHRVNGKVLPVENRHFNHWNTDPWTLDYGGDGRELASGTVFLLPYYMGLYHGFVEKP
ncbi:MAG: hypothetical protein JNN07_21210 [Verrucomicrobiales bacterium]|nr:hypothetical protein [Verrucomicrobiales bacterium]